MVKKVDFAPDRFEVYVSSAQTLVFALFIEALLLGAIYIFTVRVRDYVFIVVLSFFFLAIASGILPMIRSIRDGNRTPVWGASRAGIEVPAQTTTWTSSRPPVVHDWDSIKKIVFVGRFTYPSIEGRATTSHALVAIFKVSQPVEHELAQANPFRKLWKRKPEGSGERFRFLPYPRKLREEILEQLRDLAPDSVHIEELQRYEIG